MDSSATNPRHPIRLGIVGLGNFGHEHARTALALSEFEVVALVDRDEACLDAFSQNTQTWTDLERALAETETDAWIVASSTASHVPLTRRLLEAGKHVLVEKPLAPDLESAASLQELVERDGEKLMLGHVVLFNSEFRALQGQAKSRDPITFLDFVRHRPASTVDAFPGESPFHLTMVHDLYLALALKPDEDPVEISARSQSDDRGNCHLALADLRWADGTRARFAASFLTPPGMGTDGFDRLEVFGKGWSARIFPNPRPFELYEESASWPAALEIFSGDTSCSGMLAEQLRHFARVASGDSDIPAGARFTDALRIQRWLEEMIAQARTDSSE